MFQFTKSIHLLVQGAYFIGFIILNSELYRFGHLVNRHIGVSQGLEEKHIQIISLKYYRVGYMKIVKKNFKTTWTFSPDWSTNLLTIAGKVLDQYNWLKI